MVDREISKIIADEEIRQQFGIELIASENYCSKEICKAVGSCLTNKYAEGYPGYRYYGGCVNVDKIETIAKARLTDLFNCEYCNVQPHSGSQANMAVFIACLQPGDTVFGMNIKSGGHLTHGYKINFSGKFYNAINYEVNPETGLLDYEAIEKQAMEIKPKLIVCGASAYPREINFKRFKEIADKCGALLMADIAHIAGLVATGLHQSPIPYCDFVTSTTHKTLRGPRGGIIMCKKEWAQKIDSAVFPGTQGGPLMHVIAGKAICFLEALQYDYKLYMRQVIKNTKSMADAFTREGFKVITNGTDNHLLLLDLRPQNITGKEAEDLLQKYNITVNKNSIPNDPLGPTITSGIRIGTAAITTLGFNEDDCILVAEYIIRIINDNTTSIYTLISDLLRRVKDRNSIDDFMKQIEREGENND